MNNLTHTMLNYIGMRLVPPPTNPVDPPSDFVDEGTIGNISYAGILQVKYHVSDCTIIFFNPYTGLLRIRVAMNRGNEYKSDLVVKILNKYYAIDDFQGGFYHWALNGPWQTYFKIDPKITLPADAWETNSSVMSGDHSKDSTGLRYVWNIIKAPRHDFFQYAKDIGIARGDGQIVLDPDSTNPKYWSIGYRYNIYITGYNKNDEPNPLWHKWPNDVYSVKAPDIKPAIESQVRLDQFTRFHSFSKDGFIRINNVGTENHYNVMLITVVLNFNINLYKMDHPDLDIIYYIISNPKPINNTDYTPVKRSKVC